MTAFITGITGQDGSYLSEFLASKGYDVHGLVRRASSSSTGRLAGALATYPERIHLHFGDLTDFVRLTRLIDEIRPDEVYNLAAQSQVGLSFESTGDTYMVDAVGAAGLMDVLRLSAVAKTVRVFQACTSEMFGAATVAVQDELTPFHPASPYAVAKLAAYWASHVCRDAHGLFASTALMYSHESPRRGETFVTRKITQAVARIKHGLQKELALGNIDVPRDWGYAGDFVDGMWRILQHDHPDDFVLATGELHTIREFVQEAFAHVGLAWERYVRVDSRYFRPSDGATLCGCWDKARVELGWTPKVKFIDLVHMMVDADMRLVAAGVNSSR